MRVGAERIVSDLHAAWTAVRSLPDASLPREVLVALDDRAEPPPGGKRNGGADFVVILWYRAARRRGAVAPPTQRAA
jgi:hypothetical protein